MTASAVHPGSKVIPSILSPMKIKPNKKPIIDTTKPITAEKISGIYEYVVM